MAAEGPGPRRRARGRRRARTWQWRTSRTGLAAKVALHGLPPWMLSLALVILGIDLAINLAFFRQILEPANMRPYRPVELPYATEGLPDPGPPVERGVGGADVLLRLEASGDGNGSALWLDGAPLEPADLRRTVRALVEERVGGTRLRTVLFVSSGVARSAVESTVRALSEAGVKRIEIRYP